MSALVVQASSLGIITIRTNWDQEVQLITQISTLLYSLKLVVSNAFISAIQAKKATERVYDAAIPSNVVS